MSKKSCEAAESVEDAVLRMARVNSNIVLQFTRARRQKAPAEWRFLCTLILPLFFRRKAPPARLH